MPHSDVGRRHGPSPGGWNTPEGERSPLHADSDSPRPGRCPSGPPPRSRLDPGRGGPACRRVPQRVSDFETGKTSVDLATVLRLLETLDVSLYATAGIEPVAPPAQSDAIDLDEVLDRYLRR